MTFFYIVVALFIYVVLGAILYPIWERFFRTSSYSTDLELFMPGWPLYLGAMIICCAMFIGSRIGVMITNIISKIVKSNEAS